MKDKLLLAFCLSSFIASGGGRITHAQVVTAPLSSEGGTSSSATPFGASAQTTQILLEQSVLGSLSAGSQITGIAFRLNGGGAGTYPSSDVTFSDYEIRLANTSTTAEGMTTTFADNFSSSTLVRDGALTLTANTYSRGSVPNSFGPAISFNQPSSFTYSGGNLVIEIRSSGATGGSFTFVDLDNTPANGSGTTYQTVYAAGDSAAPTGGYFGTPIVQITYTPVPEPGSWAAFTGLALAGFALVRIRGFRR